MCRLQGDFDQCIGILVGAGRLPEAAFFARTYAPSAVPGIVAKWKVELAKAGCICAAPLPTALQLNGKAAEALADPTVYDNLFPEYKEALVFESFLRCVACVAATWLMWRRSNPASRLAATQYSAYVQESALGLEVGWCAACV